MCYFTLREECRLRVCENRSWKKTFWCKRDKVTGDKKKLHHAQPHDVYSSSDDLIGQIKENEIGGSCGTRGGVVHMGFWWGNVKEGLGVGGKVILKLILQK